MASNWDGVTPEDRDRQAHKPPRPQVPNDETQNWSMPAAPQGSEWQNAPSGNQTPEASPTWSGPDTPGPWSQPASTSTPSGDSFRLGAPSGFSNQAGYSQAGYPAGGAWFNAPAVPMRPRMGLAQAMTAFLQNYFRFDGRAGLSEYWLAELGNVIVLAVLELLSAIGGRAGDGSTNAFGELIAFLIGAWLVGTIIPNVALAVRRLHDTNHSGWTLLLILIPLVGGVFLLVFLLNGSVLDGAPSFDGPEQPRTGN